MSEWLTLAVAVGALAVIVLIVIATRRPKSIPVTPVNKETKPPSELKTQETKAPDIPSTVLSSVGEEDVKTAEEDLRILSVEKEIVSFALTRLYEAQAEGKITEGDKTRLLGKYKEEMDKLEKNISNKQMVVRLHELESTQADLVRLFQDKFNEITRNIDTIRTDLGLIPKPTPPKEEAPPEALSKEKKPEEKPPQKPRTPPKSKAEEKIANIQQEVLKILERLEKQETEG
jgi:hypothetical protein